MKDFLLLFFLTFYSLNLAGQGIRGLLTDEKGDPLPYASIYIKEKGTGTSSNKNGHYELRLPPGEYMVTYQFVGYSTEVRQVKVGPGFEMIDISLEPRAESLQEVGVTGSAEDPAYTIMRKAIAKAPYHLLQCDGYSAEVYMKGSGKLHKIPGLFSKMAANQGVDTSRVFTSESVSEIRFERPNTFVEKVISVRTSGEELAGANPNSYVNTSFYKPIVSEAISPFSPRAFSYYKFRYTGNFKDRGSKIHQIEVKPRSAGEKVFEGTLFIRDKFWNIHSLDLHTRVEFFELHLVQFFAPIRGEIWMPVTQKYEFEASFMGFAGEYRYLASVNNYKIDKNEELDESVILVDEKIEEAPEEIEAIKEKKVDEGVKEVFEEDKEVSRKQFRKLMEQYDKAEREESGEEDIISDYTYEIDSTAANKDSSYWAQMRSVPLTEKEVEGYRKDDSTYTATGGDSARANWEAKFQASHILFGGISKLNDRLWMELPGLIPRFRFNTVEGFNLDAAATFNTSLDTMARLKLEPTLRYGFSSTRLYGKLHTEIESGRPEQLTTWSLEGGRFIQQFHEESIHPFINSVYSLFLERNYMRLYQRDYLMASYTRNFRYKFEVGASAKWASRSSLSNNSDFKVFDLQGEEYNRNRPVNIEAGMDELIFENNQALTSSIGFWWKPWLKYRKYNGILRPINGSSPEFGLWLNSGWNQILESDVKFQQLEFGFKDEWKLGVRATVDLDLEAGTFLDNSNMLFTDYKHFDGGLTELAPLKLTGNYRSLDYYLYSTKNNYLSALTHVRFRKLLFTHIPIVRLSGVKENLFVNYLKTTHSPHYTEVGYTIDNIFRVLRLEFVHSFRDEDPYRFAIRVGVASVLDFN